MKVREWFIIKYRISIKFINHRKEPRRNSEVEKYSDWNKELTRGTQ